MIYYNCTEKTEIWDVMNGSVGSNATLPVQKATGMFITQIAMNAFIFVSGFIGNLCVAVIILRRKRMQTVTNWLVLNLAIVDLAIVILTIPISLVSLYTKWPLGQVGCIIIYPTLEHFAGVCVLTHTALGMVRCLIVKNSMTLREVSVRGVRAIIVFIWAFSFLILSAPLMGVFADITLVKGSCRLKWKSPDNKIPFFLLAFIVTYVIPMVVSGVSYSYIHHAISANIKNLYGHMSEQIITSRREKSRQIDKILMIMYILFGISTLPLQLFYLSDAFHAIPKSFMRTSFGQNMATILQALFYAQVVWNPLVLFFMGEEYRKEIFKLPICSSFSKRHKRSLSYVVRGSFRGVLHFYRKRRSLQNERRRSSGKDSMKRTLKGKSVSESNKRNLLRNNHINGTIPKKHLESEFNKVDDLPNGNLSPNLMNDPTYSLVHVLHNSTSSDIETQNLIKVDYSNSVSCESEIIDTAVIESNIISDMEDDTADNGNDVLDFFDPVFGTISLQYDDGKETVL